MAWLSAGDVDVWLGTSCCIAWLRFSLFMLLLLQAVLSQVCMLAEVHEQLKQAEVPEEMQVKVRSSNIQDKQLNCHDDIVRPRTAAVQADHFAGISTDIYMCCALQPLLRASEAVGRCNSSMVLHALISVQVPMRLVDEELKQLQIEFPSAQLQRLDDVTARART